MVVGVFSLVSSRGYCSKLSTSFLLICISVMIWYLFLAFVLVLFYLLVSLEQLRRKDIVKLLLHSIIGEIKYQFVLMWFFCTKKNLASKKKIHVIRGVFSSHFMFPKYPYTFNVKLIKLKFYVKLERKIVFSKDD